MKRRAFMLLAALLSIGSALDVSAAGKDELILYMVPREEETVRLGMDLVEKYGSMLIAYQTGADQAVSLQGWTGTQWVTIRPEAFRAGDFFRIGPASAVIVEKAGTTVPQSLIPPASWCPAVSKITTTELRPLLHLTGRYYDISYKDWKWFAKRYSMTVDEINPDGVNIAWYHRRLDDNLKARNRGAYDRQYWVTVRKPEPLPPAEPPAEQPEAGLDENPLTNEAPAAVIMGAGEAEEVIVDPTDVPAEVQPMAETPAEPAAEMPEAPSAEEEGME